MAQFYLRTREEAVEDGILCAGLCEHRDCAATRRDIETECRYCGKLVAGSAAFLEDGKPVHARCVLEDDERNQPDRG